MNEVPPHSQSEVLFTLTTTFNVQLSFLSRNVNIPMYHVFFCNPTALLIIVKSTFIASVNRNLDVPPPSIRCKAINLQLYSQLISK